MPLVIAPLNTELRVIKVLTNDKVKKYLESLGITINSILTIIAKANGSVICIIKDGRDRKSVV